MKKLLLVAVAVVGVAGVSQAGVRFNINLGFPVPQEVVISRPAPVCEPAPVVVAPQVCAPAPVVVQTPVVCEQPVVLPRPVYYPHRYPVYHRGYNYGYVDNHRRDNNWHDAGNYYAGRR
jgi:hypothetical protein